MAPKIAIIGAGPAGLTLARLLHISAPSLSVSVFERDASPTSRTDQGGTLDLHTKTGLAAIRACGLWHRFLEDAKYDGQEKIMVDKNGTEMVHMRPSARAGQDGERPEIDRQKLRELLVESLPAGIIRWGRQLKRVTGEGMLVFDEGVEGPFDLVVGADGAWSKVRARLTDTVPRYSGVSGFEMDIPHPRDVPGIDRMVGQGMYMGSSDRKFLNARRMGDGSVKVRTWYLCGEHEDKNNLEKLGKEGYMERIMAMYEGWAPEMTAMLTTAELDSLKQLALYELPVGSKWQHKPGFTLIGDAASLATPFSGEGVNKAMKDSMELAELIMKSQKPHSDLSLDQAVALYEKSMFPYAEALMARTMANKNVMFGDDTPIGLMTHSIKVLVEMQEPSLLMKVAGSTPVLAIAYAYFWTRKQLGLAVRTYWRRN